MKRLSVLLLTAVASVMLLSACSQKEAPPPAVEETLPPSEELVRSKITNEWIAKELDDQRPIAVMIPNEAAVIPHYGLSEASVLYECCVEGRMTRMLGIFEDYASIKKLGNVRSLRDYYVYWAFEWDAVICHFGGPYYIDEIMAQSTTDHLDGNVLSAPFFRTAERDAPHNAFLNGTLIQDALTACNIDSTDRQLADSTHYLFSDVAFPNTLTQYADAEDASFLDMSEAYPVTRCYFRYHPEDHLYYRFQYLENGVDAPHIDGTNDKQLSFANIVIESHEYEVRDQKGYLSYETIGSGDAWYLTEGKLISCTWEKTGDYAATRYYDFSGNEILFNTGKTMVFIIKDGDTFSYGIE